jgi:hypothetical protein
MRKLIDGQKYMQDLELLLQTAAACVSSRRDHRDRSRPGHGYR